MKNPGHFHFIGASLLSAVLLSVSWQPFSLVFPAFFGFIPLLWMEQRLREQQKGTGWVLLYASLAFFTWNACTTWWIWNATPAGSIAAFFINTAVMCLPFMLYHRLQGRVEGKRAQYAFIFLWIAMEYGHARWEFMWTWLTLGNVFSTLPQTVQWYEYTGALGGSLWILYVNVKLFQYFESWNTRSKVMRYSKAFNLVFFLFFAPVFLSLYILNNTEVHGKSANVVVVQPNIDPYKDKFEGMSPMQQTQKMLLLAEQAVDSTTQLVCFPETALVGSINEESMLNHAGISLVRDFIGRHPNVTVLTGADTYKFYPDKEYISATARKYNGDLFYDSYNTALLIDRSPEIQVYHKAKLVPGVEKLPYASAFSFITELAVDLGGTSGSLGSDSASKVFTTGLGLNAAPVICYESIFGEYVSSYVQKGADLICVITNDGWWGNSPGYAQHFDYARLRAVETRRYIARSANTGISGFIDAKGNVMSKSGWWQEAALKGTVILNKGETFYVKYGDYIGLIGVLFSFFNLVVYWKKKQ